MKLMWKNLPISKKEEYRNRNESKLATILGKEWCDSKLNVWLWFVGCAGINNNLNGLAVSLFVEDIISGKF